MSAIALLAGERRTFKCGAAILLVIALGCAIIRAQWFVRLAHAEAEFRVFVGQARNLHRKMVSYCELHPGAAMTTLSDYVEAGALAPDDTNWIAGAEVRVHPYLPAGNDTDIFFEIRRGKKLTLVSQVGGVLTYNTNEVTLLNSSMRPSGAFSEALMKLRTNGIRKGVTH